MVWKNLFLILVLVIISSIIFNIIKKYLFTKIKIKKKYVIAASIILIALPLIFYKTFYDIPGLYYIQTVLLSILILVYMEIRRYEKELKNKPVIGRPKPKANRSKNIK